MEKIVLAEKLASFHETWSPRIVAELNGQAVKLAKLEGEFEWHRHAAEDELFLVLHGTMRLHFRDRSVDVGPGEMIVVPAGVEHKPESVGGQVHVMLFEPDGTRNTGDRVTERTIEQLPRI